MSHFHCEHCGALIADSPRGYVTGCEHYPVPKADWEIYSKPNPRDRWLIDALVELYGKKEDGDD